MLGLVDPIDPIHSEIASKSNPRQTETLGPLLASLLMDYPPLPLPPTQAEGASKRPDRRTGKWEATNAV
jgi:hypothetical protein